MGVSILAWATCDLGCGWGVKSSTGCMDKAPPTHVYTHAHMHAHSSSTPSCTHSRKHGLFSKEHGFLSFLLKPAMPASSCYCTKCPLTGSAQWKLHSFWRHRGRIYFFVFSGFSRLLTFHAAWTLARDLSIDLFIDYIGVIYASLPHSSLILCLHL